MTDPPRPRHPVRWLLAVLGVVLLTFGVAIQVARQRATDAWDEVGGVWDEWIHERPSRIRGARDVVPRGWWAGLEGTISWPAHRQEAQGSLLHANREVQWVQRDIGFEVVVRQDRDWLALDTHIRLIGATDPPEDLVAALREVLGEDGVEVVVEP